MRGIQELTLLCFTLRKKCPYSELFWSVFSSIQTEYGEISPNTDTFHAVLMIMEFPECCWGTYRQGMWMPPKHGLDIFLITLLPPGSYLSLIYL